MHTCFDAAVMADLCDDILCLEKERPLEITSGLYDFVEQLRQTPQWNQLLLVVTADHGINYQQIDQMTPLQKHHIPMLWLGGAVKEPAVIDALCNQSDLAAILFGQLRQPHDEFTFSRDVLSLSYVHPLAVNNYNNAQWITDSTGHLLYDFNTERLLINKTADGDRLQSVSKAILQKTANDLQNR